MIRVRTTSGATSTVTTDAVVEVCDSKGRVAVLILQEGNGAISIITPGDPRLTAHAVLTGCAVSDVKVHEPINK